MIRFGIPNQGRLHALAKYVVQQLGLLPDDENLKHKLYFKTSDPDIDIVLMRGEVDLPRYLTADAIQLGVVGCDYVTESAPGELVPICDLGWFAGDLCLIARASDAIEDRFDLKPGDRIYSQYPNATRNLIFQSGLEGVYPKEIRGAAEGNFEYMDDCRAIIDIVATGDTMRAHNLKIVEKLEPTSAWLYTNPESYLRPLVNAFAYKFREMAATVNENTLDDVSRANAPASVNPPKSPVGSPRVEALAVYGSL